MTTFGPSNNKTHWTKKTRPSILGSDGMMKSDCSLSLWLLFECSLSILRVTSEYSEYSWSHPEVILMSSWRIWGQKMKIVWSRQTFIELTDKWTNEHTFAFLELLSGPKIPTRLLVDQYYPVHFVICARNTRMDPFWSG